jgi:antitoxin (DNA-binding transcriptional repressor) of toxin-antitoxin stability system
LVRSLKATDAARRFSELLDAVEQRGETFLVIRRGRAVARIGPARVANGKAVKKLLRSQPPDKEWGTELRELRASLTVEDRSWSG